RIRCACDALLPAKLLAVRDHAECPAGKRIHHLTSDLGILPPAVRWQAEGMISVLEQLQRCARAKTPCQPLQQAEIRELVARPLQKKHRHLDIEKMLGALVGRPPGGMQRKAQKREAADARWRGRSLRLRRHASAE